MLKLYHGTNIQFDTPQITKCKPYRDFGCGFYLTENYIDALTMAVRRENFGFVYTYLLNESVFTDMAVLDLGDSYSDEWLSFVIRARMGISPQSNYDLVIGNMAGGGSNLKSKFRKFRNANTDIGDIIWEMRRDLTNTVLGAQYAFLSENALLRLELADIQIIEKENYGLKKGN